MAALVSFDPEPPVAAVAQEVAEPQPAPAAVDYAPDEERRAKFFARLHRWGKKEAG
jgi:hypothetical protein